MKLSSLRARKTTISGRLLICFLICTLIPTILVTGVVSFQFSRQFRQTALEQMQVSLGLINNDVNNFLDEINVITSAPYYHSYFSSRESMDPASSDYLLELDEFQTEMQSLINLTTYSRSDISDLLIYSDGHYLYYELFNQLRYINRVASIDEEAWYIHALEGAGQTVFTPAYSAPEDSSEFFNTSSFYITRKIVNLKQPDQINMIILNFNTRSFDSMLKNLQLLYDSFVVITNENDELIYSSKALSADTLACIQNGEQFQYDSSHWVSISTDSESYPLKIYITYSLDDLSRQITLLLLSIISIYLLGLLVAFVLYRYYNRWITRAVRTLQQAFVQVENGNMEAQCPPIEVEEFNQVGNSVNTMISRLNTYIKENYLITIEQKNTQLLALQSQVQPHFLINTLYCFMALNQIGEKEKLNSAFYSLVHLLRYVLSKERFTTVGKELRFLEDYLKLQKLRFGDRLDYVIQCPEEYDDLTIPILLLQPLVENALIHGIEPCEHPCLCRISVLREEDFLILTVEDNGIGFDPAELETRSQTPSQDSRVPVGMHYVRERLKLLSEDAFFTIRCEDVTCAEIKIPWEVLCNESSDH